MMLRKIIEINADLCNGCGACASACHEGAIGMVNGKAKLLRDDYCDGLGDCLPVCPTDAIRFVQREADAYDEAAVKASQVKKQGGALPCGCPGTHAKAIERTEPAAPMAAIQTSELNQWPVQIKLVPVNAPYLNGAHLLIAADCCAYAYGNFHGDFMRNKVTLIGCPKLDEGDYSEKLTEILKQNDIKSVTVVRMEVPCCGGIEHAVKTALKDCGRLIPWQAAVLSTDGRRLELQGNIRKIGGLSWYEQNAVCILLTLLHLGIKHMLLEPTRPAFLSQMCWSTPKADLKKILG